MNFCANDERRHTALRPLEERRLSKHTNTYGIAPTRKDGRFLPNVTETGTEEKHGHDRYLI